MKNKETGFFRIAMAVFLAAVFAACAGKISLPPESEIPAQPEEPLETWNKADIVSDLDRIAEIERAGAFFPGLAIAESAMREKAGDLAGAAVAAYKELSWAYGYGSAAWGQIEEGLQNALILVGEGAVGTDLERSSASAALRGCIAFAREEWGLAETLLAGVCGEAEEADSFLRWMLLVCAMEQRDKNSQPSREIRSAYGIIRARYTLFPEYWYRGARAFSSRDGNESDETIATSFAEQCINICPTGPFAADCRRMLAVHVGLSGLGFSPDAECDYSGLRTKAEIENTIRASVSGNNPSALEDLFPLIALPENPYTVFALGALKTLSSVPIFRSYFLAEANKSSGRLGERLNYISRG